MKFCALFTTAMMASSVSAFAPSGKIASSTALKQSIDYNPGPGGFAPNSALSNDPVDTTLMNMFPTDIPMRKMQGGGTVRTWDIPPEAERLSYYIRTNGRPLKAMVELVSQSFHKSFIHFVFL